MELQEAFQAAYDASFHERRLPYKELLSPPLSADEEAWVKERLAGLGSDE